MGSAFLLWDMISLVVKIKLSCFGNEECEKEGISRVQ